MLQASYTRLLNSNNFAAIGDSDRVYNTTPEGLAELVAGVAGHDAGDGAAKPSLPDYIGVANYCKSLVLNPAINSFNLQVDDIMRIWETRLLCMFIVNLAAKKHFGSTSSTGLVSDKMLQVEAGNVLDQVAYLNSATAGASAAGDVLQKQCTHPRSRKDVKLDRQFANLLLWIKHAGRDLVLLDHYYKEAFRARTSGQHDQDYLGRLQFAILGVLLRRKELFTAYTIANQENQLTSEQMLRVRDRIDNNTPDTDLFCLRLSLEPVTPGTEPPSADRNRSPSPLYRQLAQTLDACT